MHAYLALALALAGAARAPAARLGHEREIDAAGYHQVPKLLDYVLSEHYLGAQRSKSKLITKSRPEEALAADNVILESNAVKITRPARTRERPRGGGLVRARRGYNLENVVVPARYPYLPAPRYGRFRRGG